MTAVDPQLLDLVEVLLADHGSPDSVRASEREGTLSRTLIEAFTGAELHHVGIRESDGGAGGTPTDAAAILKVAGVHASPLPVAEQALLGGWLLTTAGIELPDGLLTTSAQSTLVASAAGDQWTVSGTVSRAPWAQQVGHVVALAQGPGSSYVVMLPTHALDITPGRNLAGERRDTVRVDATVPSVATVDSTIADRLEARGAITRAILLAGATQSVLSMAVEHAQQREQFGRPINKFQAVATHLARIAEEAVVATAAADLAVRALGTADELGQAQVAKVAAGEAATTAARLAHQVHGAMGVAAECDLQLFTRRIWAWRDEYGGETRWARRLGQRVFAAGAAGAWDIVCGAAR